MAKSVIFNLITKYSGDGAKKAAKGLDQLNTKINTQLKEGAKKGAAAGGIAAGGAFVAGLTGMINLDNARGKMEAQLGLTKQQSQRVGDVAGKLYASAYGESMEDVQTSITAVIQNMDGMRTASNDALQQTSARAMDVATVLGEDVGPVTVAVSQMMKTGLAKNSQEAFDIITRGAQTGANKAEDLLDTFNEYGTQLRKLGIDGQTAMGLIQQGLQGGARDADIVADSLKEFSIRAIDGSKTTVAGFKDLGLNADAMAKQIAAGGPMAAKGLDTVLDRLRGIKDPIKQSAIATSLFGTQWEDMGAALLKMDPSSAVQALGKVSGAADRAGKSLGGTTQARFEAFKRSLQQNIQGSLVSVIGFFQQHTVVAKILAGVVATLTAAYVTYNAVAAIMAARTALMTSGTVANTIVTKIAAAASKAWAAAQWLLNAAMTANPIGLIIVAIVALVAGIVLAYKHSETFRTIVNAVWAGVKNAVMQAWAFIRPTFMAIAHVLINVIGTALRWYWAYVKFVFTVVTTIIRVAWSLIRPVFSAIASFVRGALSVAFIVFRNVIKVVWIGIQLYIKIAWTIIKTYFMAIKWYVQNVLAPIFRWLWNSVIKPVWNGIRAVISTQWNAIKTIWNALRSYLAGPLSAAFRSFRTAISTIWNGVRSTIGAASNGIKTIFNGLKSAVNAVRQGFKTAVDGIAAIWNRLKGVAKGPVNFVIGLYNNGIVRLVNGIAGLAGIKTRLDRVPTFATGGIMPGYAPGRDSLVAAVSPGEAIMRPEWTKAMGPGRIAAMNAVARQRGPAGVRNWMAGGEGMGFSRGGVVPGFAGAFGLGGIVDGFLGGAKKFAFGNVEKVAKSTLDKVLGGSVPGSGLFHDAIARIPAWIKTNIWAWIKKNLSGVGGKGMRGALNWAKSQSGKPYQWGGNGNPSWDCCLTGSSRIYGPDGARPIRDVRAGDRVFAHVEGRLEVHTVTAAWQSRHQPVFAVRTRNRTVTASANHPFLKVVMLEQSRRVKGGRRGEQVPARYGVAWARLDELKRGDLLVQPRVMAPEAKPHPGLADGTPVDLDVAWLIGAAVGDGTVTASALRLCMYGEDRDRATRIITARWACRPGHSDKHGVIASSTTLARALTELGMRRLGPDKRVPEAVWTWPTELQRAFLDGYCDADGHRPADQARHGERTYASTSPELIADVRALHIMLGDAVSNVTTNWRTKPITIKGKVVIRARPLHSLTVWRGRKSGELALRRRPGLAAWLDSGDFTLAPVLEVEHRGSEDTWDLAVEGAHNFVADGVVVHNSGFMSAIESVIRGEKPHRRWATSSFNGGTPSGWHRNAKSGFMIGVLDNGNAHASHTAGTLLGTNVESSGSGGVRVGGGARGYNDGMFPWHYGLQADTGALSLSPGWNPPVFNGTGRPELLTTRRPDSGRNYNITVQVPPGADLRLAGTYTVRAIQEYERRNGKGWRS